jgi:hypothetical protein
MGLLDMQMSGAPKRMKPLVDMAGRRKPVNKRPKKVKVRPTITAHALARVKGAL